MEAGGKGSKIERAPQQTIDGTYYYALQQYWHYCGGYLNEQTVEISERKPILRIGTS